MKLLRCAGAVAVTAMLTVPLAYADPAPPVESYSLQELVGPYPSDFPARGNHIAVLDGFTAIRDTHPDLVQRNLDRTVEINNNATPIEQQRALFDADHERLLSLSDALGEGLGEAFRVALAEGRLPKVHALLGGEVGRAVGVTNLSLLEKQHWNNPRPFEVSPDRIHYYFGDGVSGSADPYVEVGGTSSYPSGHTSGAYLNGILLADMLPELASQILARASEVGNSRIVLGVHYPLDVMGGRIMGQVAAAQRLNDPAFARLVDEAEDELRAELERSVGVPLGEYMATDAPYRRSDVARDEFRERMTYGFDLIDPSMVNDIPAEAAVLMRSVAPELTDGQRLDILRRTAIPAGYPLDQAGPDGGWLRIDLPAAYGAL
ncbi:acid phosphatase [Rhodococcus artemisiae]|uniref:Phosphatase PAP2 family protein n=1 Tax=Rhodococcus artemisiae TaxID=714159 RepID=A0ABU7LHN3_9NOCA|nr:phosphatase PAP2 family protein [Rhodococcus artemisiae]MEE2060764.1 phosphatase PAP2 family protein [Rhodococcus artemisiae]